MTQGGATLLPSGAFLESLGAGPLWVSGAVLAACYALIVSDRVNRTVAALLGAGAMVLLGVLTQRAAAEGVDVNTLALLIGMMAIVGIARGSGMFEYAAIRAAQAVGAKPRLLLAALALVTAALSALLDNVTTVMLVVPVTLLLVQRLKLPAYPFLFSQIFASNTGGAATLIGDPPNIMIGSAAGLTFMQFLQNVAAPSVLALLATTLAFDLVWGRRLKASRKDRDAVLAHPARAAITDPALLVKSLSCIALALAGFIVGPRWGVEPGTAALCAATLLLLLDGLGGTGARRDEKLHNALGAVEWGTIFFFIGLFIVVRGVEQAGLLEICARKLAALTQGDVVATGLAIMWGSAVLSALIDNIPFVAAMIPVIKAMGPALGGDAALEPLWWCLALGACLGGNGSLVGAAANLIVAGHADRAGHRIPFMTFLVLAFPLMLLTIALASVWALLFYF